MNRRRTFPLILVAVALLFAALGCGPVASETPLPDEAIIALTVQAALAANGTQQPPANLPP